MNIRIAFRASLKEIKPVNVAIIEQELENLADKFEFRITKLQDNRYQLLIYPLETLYLKIEEYSVIGEIVTTKIGPGYHHHIISFIEEFIKNLELKINIEDSTDYWEHRDFNLLQTFFIKNLKEDLITIKDYYPLLYWPFNWYPISSKGIITHMGEFNKSYLDEVIDKNNVEEFSKKFYIWINKEKDEYYYRNLAVYILNCSFTWVEAKNDYVRETGNHILDFIDKALKLNKSIEIPENEINELKYLFGKNNELPKYNDKPIGYRRDDIKFKISSYWSIVLPGFYNYFVNGDWNVFEDGARSFIVRCEYENDIKSFRGNFEIKGFDTLITHETKTHKYIGKFCYNENNVYQLIGEIISENTRCFVSIVSPSFNDKDWIIETFKRIEPYLEKNNYFKLNYQYEYLTFSEKGILLDSKGQFIPYDNIDFKTYIVNELKLLIFLFKNEKYYIDGGQINISENVVHWIKEYDIFVENLDLLEEKTKLPNYKRKFMMLEKLPKIDKIALLIFFILINTASFLNLLDKKENSWFIVLIFLLIFYSMFVVFFNYSYTRKLIISNVGITLVSRLSKTRIFILYENMKNVEIQDKIVKINGKYSKIEFKYNPKIISEIEKYVVG